MRRTRRLTPLAVAVGLATCGLAGCGLVRQPAGGSTVALTATRDFGASSVARGTAPQPRSGSIPVRRLGGSVPVTTGRGGAITSVGGVDAGPGRRWYQYVNGVQSEAPVSGAAVSAGYRVWWDLHTVAASGLAPAVVGSYPEPFTHGIGGKRLPVVLTCADDVRDACSTVSAALARAGVPVALQGLGTGSGPDTLAIVVGVFAELSGQVDAALIQKGPSASGVYARFAGGRLGSVELLDSQGRPRRTLGPGAGLVAATRDRISEPTWLITGTDRAGVRAAAAALTAARLRDRFALAVSPAGDVPVPLH